MARDTDKLPITMIVEANGRLSPATSYDFELMDQRYSVGQEVEVTFHARKSRQAEKFFWMKVNRIVGNTEYPDSKALVTAALIRLNYIDEENSVKLIGNVNAPPSFLVVPRSTSTFDKKEFQEFTERFWDMIGTEVIPGLDVEGFLKDGRIFVDEDI